MSCRRQFSICFPSSVQQTGIYSDFFQHSYILRHKNSLLGSCFQVTKYPVDGIVQERETWSKDIRNRSYNEYRNCCVLHDSSSQKLQRFQLHCPVQMQTSFGQDVKLNLPTVLENLWKQVEEMIVLALCSEKRNQRQTEISLVQLLLYQPEKQVLSS